MRKIAVVFAVALVLLAAAYLAAAQEGKVWRIGYLHFRPGPIAYERAFVQGLRDLGYAEGENLHIEWRWAAGNYDRLPALAAELVRLKVDLIVTGTAVAGLAAKRATREIPVVMASGSEAVENGIVASLAQPGGNVTGMSEHYTGLYLILLELLHETLPRVRRVALLAYPNSGTVSRILRGYRAAAPRMGLEIQAVRLPNSGEIKSALEAAARGRPGALVVPAITHGTFGRQIAAFSARHRVPVFSASGSYAERHFGLMAYQPDWAGMYRRAAWYVDKVLKGTKPADLPVERPDKFDLVVNLKTAKQLGIEIPPEVLFRATRVIK